MPPLVSIVIPVYNGADFLREAIDSALAQTFPDVEVIVVDDGSSDGGKTATVARSFGDRIRYLRKENGGVASALNLGLREMRGGLFSWLSHDDVYLPGKISSQVAEISRQPAETVLYADYFRVDSAGKRVGRFRGADLPRLPFRQALVADAPVNGCTVMAPKALIERVGGFDERLRATQDTDLWFRMASSCRFVHMPEAVLLSRVHPGQGTRAMPGVCLAEGNDLHIRLLESLASEPGSSAPPFGRFLLYAAVRLAQRGYASASDRALAMHLERACAGRGAAGAFRRTSARFITRVLDRRPFRRLVASLLGSCASSS